MTIAEIMLRTYNKVGITLKRERNKQERDRTVCTLETLADLIMKITNMEYR